MPYKNPENRKKYRKELRTKCKELGMCTTEGCKQKSLPGKTKCEKCKKCFNERRTTWGRTIEGRFLHNKKRIINRGGMWQLTLDEYKTLASQICTYCDGFIGGSGVGLDQIIPRGGYAIGNIVPCCHVCNRVKMEVFTYEEMMELKPFLIKFRLARDGKWSKFARFRWGN